MLALTATGRNGVLGPFMGHEVTATIRQATHDDAEVVAGIIRSSFRDVAERFGLNSENAPTHPSNCRPDWIRSDLNRAVFYYLLYSQESPVGCVALELADSSVAYLERLGVIPNQRGRGFGAALVRHASERARFGGARVVSAGIISEHAELVAWYEQLGFVNTGTRRSSHLPFTVAYLEHVLS
jgi:ribosomal protein S18 acetylase RimI-like enzyme